MQAVEYARYGAPEVFHLSEVTKPCPGPHEVLIRVHASSTNNVALVRSLGADKVIDYTKEDFTKNGVQYDIIFDTVAKSSFTSCKNSLTQKGVYLSAVLDFTLLIQTIWTSMFGGKKAKSSATGLLPVQERLKYFMELKDLLSTGKIKTVIDTHYSLSQMASAHAYVEKGHKKGNLVITINP